MKEKRFVAVDQKLIECETRPHRYERGNPINLIGDFVDSRFHDRSSQRAGIVWYGTIMKPLPARYEAALRRKTSRVEVTRVGTTCRRHAAFVSDSESEPPSRFPSSRISSPRRSFDSRKRTRCRSPRRSRFRSTMRRRGPPRRHRRRHHGPSRRPRRGSRRRGRCRTSCIRTCRRFRDRCSRRI